MNKCLTVGVNSTIANTKIFFCKQKTAYEILSGLVGSEMGIRGRIMTDTVIKCDSVYKIFGTNSKKMLQEANGNVDAKTFQENGCIVGVNNASFEVSKGEMLVVMGLSGSGKSTLLRCISRLTDATRGKIFIEGQDLLSLNNKELIDLRRNKMGMVFQSFELLPHKTALENIAFPLQIKGVEDQECINKAMDMVGLLYTSPSPRDQRGARMPSSA